MADIELVVARYAEPLDWLSRAPVAGLPTTVYDKSPAARDGRGVVALPNVGRCEHTYLTHILARYDSLPELTLFAPGSATDAHKWPTLEYVLATARERRRSVFPGAPVLGLAAFEHFALDAYAATSPANAAANPESALAPAVPRPYGAWYRTHVGTPWDRVRVATFRAIFVAHRDDIRRRPRSYYANLLHTVSGSSNPEAGHYIERSWPAIFGVTGE